MRSLRPLTAAVLLAFLPGLACTFERRPNGEEEGVVREQSGPVEGEEPRPGGEPPELQDTLAWVARTFRTAMAAGDLGEALTLFHRDVELVYGPPGSLDVPLSPGERLLMELRWRQESGGRVFELLDSRPVVLQDAAFLVQKLAVTDSDGRPVGIAHETLMLVRDEERWAIRSIHRTLEP